MSIEWRVVCPDGADCEVGDLPLSEDEARQAAPEMDEICGCAESPHRVQFRVVSEWQNARKVAVEPPPGRGEQC